MDNLRALASQSTLVAGTCTPNSRNDRIGFIGLGNMGVKMCHNLVRWAKEQELPPVTVWNRTLTKCERFRDMGCLVAPSVKEVAMTCDLIFTSLANDAAVDAVYADLLAGSEDQPSVEVGDGIRPGGRGRSTIFVSTDTIDPSLAGKLERLSSQRQHRYFLACPVFGPPAMAKTAELLVVLSGEYHARNHALYFMVPAIANRYMVVGENVEKAATLKVLGNAMVLGVIELLAETMTLADKSNVGAETLYKFILDFFPAPSFIGYGKKMIEDNFKGEEGFTLDGGIKDAKHIRRLGELTSTPMPIIDVALQHLLTAKANGGSSLDWSSLVGGQRIASGLHPFTRAKPLTLYNESEPRLPLSRLHSL